MIAIKAKSNPGSMGDLITRKDWSDSPLGPNAGWPQELRTALNIILDSRFPMFLFWGKELLCFFNDAYRLILDLGGDQLRFLGGPLRESSPESCTLIGSYLSGVMDTGESFSVEDVTVPVFHNGRAEQWMGTVSYSPVMGEDSFPAGVLAICIETTNKESTLHDARVREDQLNFILDAAELGTWDYAPKTGTFLANRRLKEWFGLSGDGPVDIQLAMEALIPGDRERLRQSIELAISRRSDGKHDIVYTVINPHNGVRRIVRAKGKAFFNDNDDVAYRFNGTLQDITDEVLAQQALKESEEKFRELMENSPVAMCLFRGDDYRIVSINDSMLTLIGRNYLEVHNLPFFETLPSATLAGLRAVLDTVRLSGERHSAYGHPFRLPRGKKMVEVFIDFAYEPIFDHNGMVNAIIVAAEDVTGQVLVQKKLDQKKEEIRREMLRASIGAQEKERELISNELHDNVNQLLACTKLFLELVEPAGENSRICIDRGSAFIGQAMEEIRDISHALNPGILNFVGLFKSIREMLEKLNRTHPIIFSFDCTRCRKEWKPNADIELTIFRIVQNQVANIVQHSGAVSANIVLSCSADFMELVISDDGRGFDTKKTRRGLGLLNIVNRAELMNGFVSLRSAPNKGCRLRIRIPARGRGVKTAVSN